MYTIDNASVMCYGIHDHGYVVPTTKVGASEKQKLGVTLLGLFCALKEKVSPLNNPSSSTTTFENNRRRRGEGEKSAREGGEEIAVKGFFNCPYCQWTGASDVMLARHKSMRHEALLAEEGEKARAREREKPVTGFNLHLHNIVPGYLHGEDKGQVYERETWTDEGILFRWFCVTCNKQLKERFEKWTPDSKERYLELKRTGRSSYDPLKQYPQLKSIIARRA